MSNEIVNICKNILDLAAKIEPAHEKLKRDNEELKKENENNTIQLKKLMIEKTEIEQQYEFFKIGKTISKNPENIFISIEWIDNLVREIDDCIVSLSK